MPTPKVVRHRRRVKLAIGLLILALIGAIATRLYLSRVAPPSAERLASLSDEEILLLELVNRERENAGQPPLKFSARLAVIARGHSYDMAIRRYFAHDSPDGSRPADRIRGVGLTYEQIAENIYMEDVHGAPRMPERAVKGWLASPHHRENMLSPAFRETGLGIAHSPDGKAYVTQDFMR